MSDFNEPSRHNVQKAENREDLIRREVARRKVVMAEYEKKKKATSSKELEKAIDISSDSENGQENNDLEEIESTDFKIPSFECKCDEPPNGPPSSWSYAVINTLSVRSPAQQLAILGGTAWAGFPCCDQHIMQLGRILGFRNKTAITLRGQLKEYWNWRSNMISYRKAHPDQFLWQFEERKKRIISSRMPGRTPK